MNMAIPESIVAYLKEPELDPACNTVWRVLNSVHEISYTELKAMADLTGEVLAPWEVEALMQVRVIQQSELEWTPDGD